MRKLLYIDDEEGNLVTLEVSLRKLFRVFTLSNPEHALNLIAQENIGVVITDQRMPGMNGLDLAERINQQFEDVIVIILTAYDDNDVMLRAINQGGIFRYILKPWDIKDLRQTLNNAFETYDLRQKNRTLVDDLWAHNNELRLAERKYRLIFDTSPLGIAHFDTKGHITRSNEQFSRITRLKKEPGNGMSIANLHNNDISKAFFQALESISSITYDGIYKPEEDVEIPVRAIFTPISEEKTVNGMVMLIEDLSDILKQEELRKQIVIAKESARFKQNFMAGMSHEIRTPLTGIIGMTEVLSQSDLNPEQKENVSILRQSGEDLREIINQVLDYSKIEAGKITLKTASFPLSNIYRKAEKLFSSICKKDILFDIHHDQRIPDYLVADELRLMQIINNLVSNAVKFTRQGKIILQTELASPKQTSSDAFLINISVTDTGKGIQEGLQKLLFTPYMQIEDCHTIKMEGTGLGLSICKQLAELHGGKIGVVSEYGKGSTFWFTVEVKQGIKAGSEEMDLSRTLPISSNNNLRILLVEDKVVNQKVLALLLKGYGHIVTIAANGEEALAIFEPGRFDLILMDIQMPVMDGVTATGKLKENYTNLPPIVSLSANALEGDREKYMAMGMDEYLVKPFNRNDFLNVLRKLHL